MVLGYCTPTQFRCNYGGCISASLVCNDVANCPYYYYDYSYYYYDYSNDLSDERGCVISKSPVPSLCYTL